MIVYLNINKKTYWVRLLYYFSQNDKNRIDRAVFFFIFFEKVFFDKKIFRILGNVTRDLPNV